MMSSKLTFMLVSRNWSVLKSERLGAVSTERIGGIRHYFTDEYLIEKMKDGGSYIEFSGDQKERFRNAFSFNIQYVHSFLREDTEYPYYEGYRLTDGEIYDLQDLVNSKQYQISPMRVIARSKSQKDTFIEYEGNIVDLPLVNKSNTIHIRFPINFMIEELPLAYHGPGLVSPFFKRYKDTNANYIKFEESDLVVISAFIMVLINTIMKDPSFFRKSCINNYQHGESSLNFDPPIEKWKDVKNVLHLDLENEKYRFSKKRIIEKLAPLVNSEEYLMNLISSLVNIPILDQAGRDLSLKTGSPMIPLLDDILFNIYLDDIDQKIEDSLPELQLDWFFLPMRKKRTDRDSLASCYSSFIGLPFLEHRQIKWALRSVFVLECILLRLQDWVPRKGCSLPPSKGKELICQRSVLFLTSVMCCFFALYWESYRLWERDLLPVTPATPVKRGVQYSYESADPSVGHVRGDSLGTAFFPFLPVNNEGKPMMDRLLDRDGIARSTLISQFQPFFRLRVRLCLHSFVCFSCTGLKVHSPDPIATSQNETRERDMKTREYVMHFTRKGQ
ncbi:unnamed protein product [Cochlearia groenlandica]